MAPSRIGRISTYDVPAATGADDTGYDLLNRRRKKLKLYPGAPKPKCRRGRVTLSPFRRHRRYRSAVIDRQYDYAFPGDGREGRGAARAPPPEAR